MGWLKNYPIPEYQLGFLLTGLALHFWDDTSTVLTTNLASTVLGGVIIAISALISVWSATSFGDEAMANPGTLRASGPYRYSRNPMYLSWLLATVGIGLMLGSWWLCGASLIAAGVTQLRVISDEEKILVNRFGVNYETYRDRTPRWFWPF